MTRPTRRQPRSSVAAGRLPVAGTSTTRMRAFDTEPSTRSATVRVVPGVIVPGVTLKTDTCSGRTGRIAAPYSVPPEPAGETVVAEGGAVLEASSGACAWAW